MAMCQCRERLGGWAGYRLDLRAYLVAAMPAVSCRGHLRMDDQPRALHGRRLSQLQQPCDVLGFGAEERLELNRCDAVVAKNARRHRRFSVDLRRLRQYTTARGVAALVWQEMLSQTMSRLL